MTEYKLSSVIDVSIAKAKAIIVKFFSSIPRVKLILDTWAYTAVTYGYIKTPAPYRRVRWFPEQSKLSDPEMPDLTRMKLIGGIARPAKNQIPQGVNADVIKDVLCTLQDIIDENNYPAEIKISVYDEILSEVREDFAEEWAEIKKQVMIRAAEKVIHRIPIKVEVNIDNYWKH
jgi:DNA polymerase I-like protein with 3'-5' exonuclease and polymerase domains